MGLEVGRVTGRDYGLKKSLETMVPMHGPKIFRQRTGDHRHGDLPVQHLEGFANALDQVDALGDALTEGLIALNAGLLDDLLGHASFPGQEKDVLPLAQVDVLVVAQLQVNSETGERISCELEVEELTVDQNTVVVPENRIEEQRARYDSEPSSKSRERELMQ